MLWLFCSLDGFRKVVTVESGSLKVEKDDMEFSHMYFLRDQEPLLEHIKRKVLYRHHSIKIFITHTILRLIITMYRMDYYLMIA